MRINHVEITFGGQLSAFILIQDRIEEMMIA